MVNQRGLAQRLERRLEDGVGDAFARMFGGAIVPQEVEALLRREAHDGVRTCPVSGSWRPTTTSFHSGSPISRRSTPTAN